MTTIPTSPSYSLTSSTIATVFILVSKDEGTWKELVVEEEEHEQEHLGDHHPHIPLLLPHLLHHGHHLHPHVPGRGHLVTMVNKMAAPPVAQLAPACRSSRSSACNVGHRIGAAGATR